MNRVLLTGGTGTIGSEVAVRLLAQPQTRVTMLVRARDGAELAQRLDSLRAYWELPQDDPRLGRLEALRGDISLPELGLDSAAWQRLAAQTTHIVHCAASVKLNMTLEQARDTAVRPTRTLVALARLAQRAGVLRKMDLVSTVGVWGRTPGDMPERPLPEVSSFHNTYEAAKAEAERVVWTEAQGLPWTVHRPSMVVGDSRTGRVMHFQVFYHLCEFLSGVRTYGVMPRLGGTRLDTVPVDWVADAICWASADEQTAGQVLHLCSGPRWAIALPRLQERVRRLWQQAGRPLPTLRVVDQRWLERLIPLIGALGGAGMRRALRALPPVLAYLAEEQGFTNDASRARLAAAGLPLPAIDTYLDTVLGRYLDARPTDARG